MTPQREAEIIQVMDQLNDMKLGRRFQVQCPFCQGYNQRGVAMNSPDEWKRPGISPFCCDSFEIIVRELCGLEEV